MADIIKKKRTTAQNSVGKRRTADNIAKNNIPRVDRQQTTQRRAWEPTGDLQTDLRLMRGEDVQMEQPKKWEPTGDLRKDLASAQQYERDNAIYNNLHINERRQTAARNERLAKQSALAQYSDQVAKYNANAEQQLQDQLRMDRRLALQDKKTGGSAWETGRTSEETKLADYYHGQYYRTGSDEDYQRYLQHMNAARDYYGQDHRAYEDSMSRFRTAIENGDMQTAAREQDRAAQWAPLSQRYGDPTEDFALISANAEDLRKIYEEDPALYYAYMMSPEELTERIKQAWNGRADAKNTLDAAVAADNADHIITSENINGSEKAQEADRMYGDAAKDYAILEQAIRYKAAMVKKDKYDAMVGEARAAADYDENAANGKAAFEADRAALRGEITNATSARRDAIYTPETHGTETPEWQAGEQDSHYQDLVDIYEKYPMGGDNILARALQKEKTEAAREELLNDFYALYAKDKESALAYLEYRAEGRKKEYYNEIYEIAKNGGMPGRMMAWLKSGVYSKLSGLSPTSEWGENYARLAKAYMAGGTENITENGPFGIKPLAGKAWGFGYQLTNSMAESKIASMGAKALTAAGHPLAGTALQAVSTVLMGRSAAAADYVDKIDAGWDKGAAGEHAFFAGLWEAGFEYISLDHLVDLDETAGILKNVFVQGGVELSEELCTELASRISDTYVSAEYSYDNDIEARTKELMARGMDHDSAMMKAKNEWGTDLLMAALGGFVSGGVLAFGGSHGISRTAGKVADAGRYVGGKISDTASNVKGLYTQNFGDWLTDTPELHQNAMESTVNRVVNDQSGGIRNAMQAYAEKNGITLKETKGEIATPSARNDSTESEASAEAAGKGLPALQNAETRKDRQKVSRRTTKALRANVEAVTNSIADQMYSKSENVDERMEGAVAVYNETVQEYGEGIKPVAQAALRNTVNKIVTETSAKGNVTATTAYQAQVDAIQDPEAKQIAQIALDRAVTSKAAQATQNSERMEGLRHLTEKRHTPVKLEAIVTGTDGKETTTGIKGFSSDGSSVVLENGAEVKVEELQTTDSDVKDAIDAIHAAKLGGLANVVFQSYLAADLSHSAKDSYRWIAGYVGAINQGITHSITVQQAVEQNARMFGLDEETVRQAYGLGETLRNDPKVQARKQGLQKAVEIAQEKGVKGQKARIDTSRIQGIKISGELQAHITAVNRIAKAVGVDVVWFSSKNADGSYSAMSGKHADGTIWLDIESGKNSAGDVAIAILGTMSHELTHFIQQYSNDLYMELQDLAMQHLRQQLGEDGLEQLTLDTVKQNGFTGDNAKAKAMEELTSQFCEKMFSMEESMQPVLADVQQNHKGLWAKIKEFFQGFIEKVRKLIEQGETAQKSEALQAWENISEEMQKVFAAKWGEALRSAKQTHDAVTGLEAAGIQVEGIKNTAQAGGEQYSVRPNIDTDLQNIKARNYNFNTELLIGTTSDFLVNKIGFKPLPNYMSATKAYRSMVAQEQAIKDGQPIGPDIHYHGLGVNGLQQVLEKAENPVVAYVSAPDDFDGRRTRLVLVTDYAINGGTGVTVVEPDLTATPGRGRVRANKDITVFSKEDVRKAVLRAAKENRLLYLDKKRGSIFNSGEPGTNNPVAISKDVLNDNIAKFWADVKWRDYRNSGIGSAGTNAPNTPMAELLKNWRHQSDTLDEESHQNRPSGTVSDVDLLLQQKVEDATNREQGRLLKEFQAKARQVQELEAKLADARKKRDSWRGKANRRVEQRKYDALARKLEKQIQREKDLLAGKIKNPQLMSMLKDAREAVYKERNQRIQDIRDQRKRTELRKRITNLKEDLQRRLSKPTDGRYVPAGLAKSLIDVLDTVDNSPQAGTKAAERAVTVSERLRALADAYESIKDDPNIGWEYQSEYDEDIRNQIKALSETMQGRNLRDLSSEDLQQVYDQVRQVRDIIRDAAKTMSGIEFGSLYDAMYSVANQQQSLKSLNNLGWYGRNKRMRILDNLSVMRAVEMMSGWDRSSALYQLMHAVENGADESWRWMMEYNKSLQELKTGKNEKAYRDALTKKNDFGVTDEEGEKVRMTKLQALQILMTAEREAANHDLVHLQKGGAVIRDALAIQDGKANKAKSQTIKVTPELLQDIRDSLTEWDRSYMEAIHKYFAKEAKATNDVLYRLKHRVLQAEAAYVPYIVDQNYLDAKLDEQGAMTMWVRSPGSTNALKIQSPKPVIIDGMDTVMAKHVKEIADYIGMAIPIRDFSKVYNGRLQSRDNNPFPVKKAIDRTFGSKGQHLLTQAIVDVQGGSNSSSWSTYIAEHLNKLQGAFVRSALLINPSVTIKQAASYTAAESILSHLALERGNHPIWTKTDESNAFMPGGLIHHIFWLPSGSTATRLYNEIDQYTSLHYQRRLGMSQAEVANEANRSGKLKRAVNSVGASMEQNAFGHAVRKAGEALDPVTWIQRMDVATTAALWVACKEQAKLDGKQVGTEEFWQRTTELYERCLRETQPMYDGLHRSANQKQHEGIMQYLFPFRTVPIQNHGQMAASYEALLAARASGDKAKIKEANRFFAKTMWAQFESAVVFASMTFLAAAMKRKTKKYRDEDEELTVESVLKGIGLDVAGTMVSNFNPLFGSAIWDTAGNIYDSVKTGKKIWSYDSFSIGPVDLLNEGMKAYGNLATDLLAVIGGKDVSWDTVKGHLNTAAVKSLKFIGLPSDTVKTYVEGTIGNLRDAFEGRIPALNDESWVRSTSTDARRFIKALEDGNSFKAGNVLAGMKKNIRDANPGIKEDNLNSRVQNAINSYIHEQILSGGITEKNAISYMVQYGGKTEDDAYWAIQEWRAKELHDGEDGYKWSKYDGLMEDIDTGEKWDNIKRSSMLELTDHGVKPETVYQQITEHIRDRFTAGELTEDETMEMMQAYSWKKDDKTKQYRRFTASEAYFKLEEWKAKAGSDDVNWSQYNAMRDALRNGGDGADELQDLLDHDVSEASAYEEYGKAVKNLLTDGTISSAEAQQLLLDNWKVKDSETKEYRKPTENEVWKQTKRWAETAEHEGELDYSYSQYDTVDEAISAGKDISGLVKELTDHGIKQEDVNSHIKTYLVNQYVEGKTNEMGLKNQLSHYLGLAGGEDRDEIVRDANCKKLTGYDYNNLGKGYKAGKITSADVKKALTQYGGMSSAEATARVRYYDFQKAFPDSQLGQSTIDKYYDTRVENVGRTLQGAGISMDTYVRYAEAASKAKGTDKDGDGKTDSGSKKAAIMQIIDKLNLTTAQKDALYYFNGWAASKIREAPWH